MRPGGLKGRKPGAALPTATLSGVKNRELEETLCRLPTVDAVRVVGDDGKIEEVHVLASPGKSPKQVVRDVQSLAMASFGITIDRRVISVVQIETDEIGRSERPAVIEIKEIPEGTKLHVSVSLGWQQDVYVGQASGPGASATRLRLVGDATLNALEQAIGDDIALALAAVDTPLVGNRQVAVAQVVMVTGGDERLMVGSALVGQDASQASVRAVLDAVNRQVPQLRR